MKNKAIYILIALILSSCGMSNNFNSQKFTSLKKIKPQKTEQVLLDDDLAQTSAERNEVATYEEEGNSEQTLPFETSEAAEAFTKSDDLYTSNESEQINFERPKTLTSPIKQNIQLDDEQPEKTAEEKKENNMFWWMMAMFILAAPASIFVVVPAIPFYLTAFILAILLIRRYKAKGLENLTVKQKRRRGLAIWVLVQWLIGLGLAGLYIVYLG